uniref:Uncharacterized protein n=1 Tax=Arundo donax TaxID=35708 RepID=A0A0A9B344_ARUDO
MPLIIVVVSNLSTPIGRICNP